MSSRFSALLATGSALVVLVAGSACAKSDTPKAGPSSEASDKATAVASSPSESATITPAGKTSTVVFEVTGTGKALTIDTVPSGPDRLYDVPLPWTDTITITPDEQQLQVVVVGTSTPGPGCTITLDGKVVAEQPVGGSAHCVFDRD